MAEVFLASSITFLIISQNFVNATNFTIVLYTIPEKELISTKAAISVKQTREPTWALEICRKLVDLGDRSRRKNLRILGIKEDPRESRKKCENMIYDLLE